RRVLPGPTRSDTGQGLATPRRAPRNPNSTVADLRGNPITSRSRAGHSRGDGCIFATMVAAWRDANTASLPVGLHGCRSMRSPWRRTGRSVSLSGDAKLIIAGQGIRAAGYGFTAVLLGVLLAARGYGPLAVGAVLTALVAGTAVASVAVGAHADRIGRRRS